MHPKEKPMLGSSRRFRLAPGLIEVLKATMAAGLDAHQTLWEKEIAAGEIGEETRAVLVAFGWLSSGSDPRLTELARPKIETAAKIGPRPVPPA
jgi:hypothetical protein